MGSFSERFNCGRNVAFTFATRNFDLAARLNILRRCVHRDVRIDGVPNNESDSTELAEDDIVDLVYCTRVIAKSRIDITGAIDEPGSVYRNEWHYITRGRAGGPKRPL